MNVLLTGATGFLGSHLARALLVEGHQIIALKRRTSDLWRLNDIAKQIHFHDLEGLDMKAPFEQHGQINAVIHTATSYGRKTETANDIFETNTAFPLRLLEMAILFNTNIFFNTDSFFTVGAAFPGNLKSYSLSKRQFREWGEVLCKGAHPKFVNFRLEHMYGPGDDPSKFTSWIVQQCIQSVSRIDLTPGDQFRDFIHVADVVSAYQSVLRNERLIASGFSEMGVGSGRPVTVRYFVEKVQELSSSQSDLNFGALPHREDEIMYSAANIDSLTRYGWRPTVSLDAGVLSLISRYGSTNGRNPDCE